MLNLPLNQKIRFLTLPLFFLVLMVLPGVSRAGYNASGLLGQFGENGQPDFSKNRPNNTFAGQSLNLPEGEAFDLVHHRLFVSTLFNEILVYNLDSGNNLVSRIADNVLGHSSFGLSLPATTQNGLNIPAGLAYDSVHDRLFVADLQNSRVLIFNTAIITNGMDAVNVLGQGNFITSNATTTQSGMSSPEDVAYDSVNDRLFVADRDNNRVLVFAALAITDGMDAVNVLGQSDFAANGTFTTQNGMSSPVGLVYDTPSQRLFVADTNSRVLIYNTAVISNGMSAVDVVGQEDFLSSNSNTGPRNFLSPRGLAFDSSGERLFVSDSASNRVLVFDTSTTTMGANAAYVLGQTDFVTGDAKSTRSGFSNPARLAYNSQTHQLFVADSFNNRVLVFDVSALSLSDGMDAEDVIGQYDALGNPVFTGPPGANTLGPNNKGFEAPPGVAMDTVHHRFFVADSQNHRVLVYNLDANNLPDFTPSFVLGQPDFFTKDCAGLLEGGCLTLATPSGMFLPYDVAYDSVRDLLFVADAQNNRVLVFDTAVIINGMPAAHVLGQPDFVSSNSNTSPSGMSFPQSVSYDSVHNRLFVADADNNRVLVFPVSAITDGMDAAFVLGQADLSSINSDPVSASNISFPGGLAYDSANDRLFVVDSDRYRILVFDTLALHTGNTNATSVLGQPDFTSSSFNYVTASQSTFSPFLLNYDADFRRLYVADSQDNRIMIFNLVKLETNSLATGTIATAYSQNFTATGSQGTISFAVASGTVPSGLALTGATLSGTPTAAGTFNFTVKVTDTFSTSTVFSDSKNFSLEIANIQGQDTPPATPSGGAGGVAVGGTSNNFGGGFLPNIPVSASPTPLTIPTSLAFPQPGLAGTPGSPGAPVPIRLINDRGTLFLILNGVREGIISPGLLASHGLEFKDAVPAQEGDLQLPLGPLLLPGDGSLVKSKQDPTVYVISSGKRYGFVSAKVFADLGFKFSSILLVTGPELQALPNGGDLTRADIAHLPGTDIDYNGTIYYIDLNMARLPYASLAVYNSWHKDNDFGRVVKANASDLSLPIGSPVEARLVN